ncbi:MAG: thymidine phosphorylase [bacterium]
MDWIRRKQQGAELTTHEIAKLIGDFTHGDIPDYQMAALLMAIYFKGLTAAEGKAFLHALISSGERQDLSSVPGVKVDKHSTGGVGDKVSLVVAPVVSSLGIPVPMISGRALGHTGGTLDKLESIPGFRTKLSAKEFRRILSEVGCVLAGQSDSLVPADRKLYALRDVTATVKIPGLIAASILSKKIAEGAQALVLDVKIGEGGFLQEEHEAAELAELLVTWAEENGVRTIALGTDMEAPLGRAAGNAPEVIEALNILKGKKADARLSALCEAQGAMMIWLGGKAESLQAARELYREAIASGRAFRQMQAIAHAQGSPSDVFEAFEKRVEPKKKAAIQAEKSGILARIHAQQIGWGLVDLGAGRKKTSDPVDSTAGIYFFAGEGDEVNAGDTLAEVVWSRLKDATEPLARLSKAFVISQTPTPTRPLVRFLCDSQGIHTIESFEALFG